MATDDDINHPLTRNEMKLIRETIEGGMAKITIRADERDKRYEERFKASETSVTTALAAQKEAVFAAFVASEKAIVKAETAQTSYNERSNEFRQALDDQAKLQLSKTEALQTFKSQDDKLEEVKNRIGKLETMSSNLLGLPIGLEDTRNRVGKIETTLASIISTSVATEKGVSNTVLYIGMVLSFLFSLIGMLRMIYSLIKLK